MYVRYVVGVELIELAEEVNLGEVEELHYGAKALVKHFCHYLFVCFYFERDGKGRRKRERNISVWLPLAHPLLRTWPATQACALTGNQTSDPVVHRPSLNPLSHTSQVSHFLFYVFAISYFSIRNVYCFYSLKKVLF